MHMYVKLKSLTNISGHKYDNINVQEQIGLPNEKYWWMWQSAKFEFCQIYPESCQVTETHIQSTAGDFIPWFCQIQQKWKMQHHEPNLS